VGRQRGVVNGLHRVMAEGCSTRRAAWAFGRPAAERLLPPAGAQAGLASYFLQPGYTAQLAQLQHTAMLPWGAQTPFEMLNSMLSFQVGGLLSFSVCWVAVRAAAILRGLAGVWARHRVCLRCGVCVRPSDALRSPAQPCAALCSSCEAGAIAAASFCSAASPRVAAAPCGCQYQVRDLVASADLQAFASQQQAAAAQTLAAAAAPHAAVSGNAAALSCPAGAPAAGIVYQALPALVASAYKRSVLLCQDPGGLASAARMVWASDKS